MDLCISCFLPYELFPKVAAQRNMFHWSVIVKHNNDFVDEVKKVVSSLWVARVGQASLAQQNQQERFLLGAEFQ